MKARRRVACLVIVVGLFLLVVWGWVFGASEPLRFSEVPPLFIFLYARGVRRTGLLGKKTNGTGRMKTGVFGGNH